ncbi:MAG: zinc-ribbon domain-containing protein, partial [Gammaproteobacteria bacterium]
MYTQCPSCRTLFRISEKQLAAARGKVRCGKCNHIYNAQGTLLNELPKPAAAPVPPPISQPETRPEEAVPAIPEETVFQRDDILDISGELPEESDDWLDEEEEFSTDELLDEDIPSIKPPSGIDEEDWQMINLGSDSDISSEFEDDDEEDAWLFGDDETDEQGGVDIVLRDQGEVLPEPEPVTAELLEDEGEDSDFMKHMSDYLDDDRAEELISDESASGILDEVNAQLNLAIEKP